MTQRAAQDHDRDLPPRHHLYGDLASWWPLISRPEEYAEEAAFAASLLRTAKPPSSHGSRAREEVATTPSISSVTSR